MLRGLVGSCHPVPTVAVTLIAMLLAVGVGLGLLRVLLVGAAVCTGQLSIGWSNDRIDAARDAATARRDKPAATGVLPLNVLTASAALALVATVVLSLTLGWRAGIAALILVAAGWSYNLGLKATVLSGLAYVVGFGALPAVAYLALPGHQWPPWWAPVTGALLGLGAHLANVLPDLRDDAATGVRGLPHRLGPRASMAVMALVLAAASLIAVLGPARTPTALGWTAATLGAVVAAASAVLGIRHPGSGVAFYGLLAVALLDVVLFVLAT